MNVGEVKVLSGFFTRLNIVIGLTPTELEGRLGYHAGRLARGWWLLYLKESIAPGEFRLAGHSDSPGGETMTETPSGVPIMARIDEIVRARSTSIDERLGTGYFLIQRQLAESFVLTGPNRIVKVVPVIPHNPATPAKEQYPRGQHAPQWILSSANPKRFSVAFAVPPTHKLLGGGLDGPMLHPIGEGFYA